MLITKNPSSLSVTNGNKATFKVSATGKKLTYQWYYKWSGASDWYAVTGNGTSATYSFTASTAHNNYYYCCKVTNSAGDSVWSSSAKLSVYIKPTITDNPSDKTVYSGYTATFRVYATGTGLTYQWYRKKPGTTEWTSVGSSGTSSAYSFTAYSYYDGYSYCCKVTNGAGDSVWCNSAKLTVK